MKDSPQGPIVTAATLNLLNDLTRWEQRRWMIVDEFKKTQPDLIALQEVVLPINTAEWLATQLGGYSVHLTPMTGLRLSLKEGIAVLSRLPVTHAEWLPLGAQHRVAQLLTVKVGRGRLMFANSHLLWSFNDSPARLRQVRRLQHWIAERAGRVRGTPVLVCGDFNGRPNSKAIRQMRAHFHSAYAVKHGHEPRWTCPTPLQFKTQPWRKVFMTLAGKAARRRDGYLRDTLDYIFVNEHVHVRDCRVALNHHAPGDPTLYASDHLALVASVALRA